MAPEWMRKLETFAWPGSSTKKGVTFMEAVELDRQKRLSALAEADGRVLFSQEFCLPVWREHSSLFEFAEGISDTGKVYDGYKSVIGDIKSEHFPYGPPIANHATANHPGDCADPGYIRDTTS